MKLLTYALCVSLLSVACGCRGFPGAGVGWEFKVHRPSVSFAPLLVDQRSGSLSAVPLSSAVGPEVEELAIAPPPRRMRQQVLTVPPPAATLSAPVMPCIPPDLNQILGDIARRLAAVDSRQRRGARAAPPATDPCPE